MVKECNKATLNTYYLTKAHLERDPESGYSRGYTSCGDITISLAVKNEPAGYKKYTHSPQKSTWSSITPYIGGIYHYERQQTGFVNLDDYNATLDVYYLDYDDSRVLPLLIKITTGWITWTYTYYKREKYSEDSNTWQTAGISQDGEIAGKLNNIDTSLVNFIVLKLDQTSKPYFANGDPEKRPEANNNTQIQVNSPTDVHDVYKKYGHRLTSGEFRLLSTRNKTLYIPFKDLKIYAKTYSSASIYYWNGDASHDHPLILELAPKSGSPAYYKLEVTSSDKKWNVYDIANTAKLRDELDKENCTYNRAHIININTNTGGSYSCLGCHKKPVSLSSNPQNQYDYIRYTHSATDGKFGTVRNGTRTIHSPPDGVNRITVYWSTAVNSPLLFFYTHGGVNKWFHRYHGDTIWTALIDGAPTGDTSYEEIQKVLKQRAIPNVEINFLKPPESYIPTETSLSFTVEEISVNKTNFYQFKHTGPGGTNFMVKKVVHDKTTLPDINSEDPLESVSAFYDGDKTTDASKLLMIELTIKGHPKRYKYFEKSTREKFSWTLFSQTGGDKILLSGQPLRNKLTDLKKILIDPPAGVNQNLESSPQHQTNKASIDPIDATLIAAAVILSLGLLGYGGWKVWKSLSTRPSKPPSQNQRRLLSRRLCTFSFTTLFSAPVHSGMFFNYNENLVPPYQVIVDTNFVNSSIQNKLDLHKGMLDCLIAKCIICVTDCVVGELEKLGHRYRMALQLVKDPRVKRLTCTHTGTYADDCIVERITMHKCYIVATNDKDLKRRIRKIPGVPIMYVANHKYAIERIPFSITSK